MAKKDFSSITTGRVHSAIEQATGSSGRQTTASQEEQQERASELRTQGRKGCKATRINMAFTPENHEFIKVMAKATGRNMTEFTNVVIAAYRKEHPEFMEQANGFLQYVNSGVFRSLPNINEDFTYRTSSAEESSDE